MKKLLLVVSFGTSYNESRDLDIGGIERALQQAFPGHVLRRAFTSSMVIRHIERRDGDHIDTVAEALDRARDEGFQEVLVQPTHILAGSEYAKMVAAVEQAAVAFSSVRLGLPLLGKAGAEGGDRTRLTGTGADGTSVCEAGAGETGSAQDATGAGTWGLSQDTEETARAMVEAAVASAGKTSLAQLAAEGTALVYMGHGSEAEADAAYSLVQAQMQALGFANVFLGTVEGRQATDSCQPLIDRVRQAGYRRVILRPFMVVSGDHAHQDMAGADESSWQQQFLRSGAFDAVTCQLEGLGRVPAIQQIYLRHAQEALVAEA